MIYFNIFSNNKTILKINLYYNPKHINNTRNLCNVGA